MALNKYKLGSLKDKIEAEEQVRLEKVKKEKKVKVKKSRQGRRRK